MRTSAHLTAALLILALPGPALSQGSPTSAPAALLNQPEQLKPGQFVWAPKPGVGGDISVDVDLTRQLAFVRRDGETIGLSTISSGMPGHESPTGSFKILSEDANHHSSKYHDAPMPYTLMFTDFGVALHAGGLPGYPESHGCIHLPLAFARTLFAVARLGDTVVVSGAAPVRAAK